MTELVHLTLKGFTSTFRIPSIVSGKSLCAPVPPYSTILGIIGCCAGRDVYPEEVRIGFEYSYGKETGYAEGYDVETTHRISYKNNKLRPHSKGTSIRTYEYHPFPCLELYLDNIDFYDYFSQPVGIPTLGRSQDLAWIESVEIVDVEPAEKGTVGATMMPFPQDNVGGRMLRCPEYFDNKDEGLTREPKNIRLFQLITAGTTVENENLYRVKSNEDDHVIYLHEWKNSFS